MPHSHVSVCDYEFGVESGSQLFPELDNGMVVMREGFGDESFVLVKFSTTPKVYKVYSPSQLCDIAGIRPVPNDYSVAYDAYLGRALDAPPKLVAAVGMDGILVGVCKALCTRCSTLVRVHEHALRCAPVGSSPSDGMVSLHRRMSWLGDAVHLQDVRSVLLDLGLEDSRLQVTAQQYLCNDHMASVYDKLVSELGIIPRCPALGGSVRQRATAFEASYADEFRLAYLHLTFGITQSQFAELRFRVERLFDRSDSAH